jgi:DNA-binding NarL/FixJ family response regulator
MLRNGASRYLLKNATKQEITDAIQTVAKGKMYMSNEAANNIKYPSPQESPVLTRRKLNTKNTALLVRYAIDQKII